MERLVFKSEGQITGFGQNMDMLMTLGCDKTKNKADQAKIVSLAL